jgi:hypothetical protein
MKSNRINRGNLEVRRVVATLLIQLHHPFAGEEHSRFLIASQHGPHLFHSLILWKAQNTLTEHSPSAIAVGSQLKT